MNRDRALATVGEFLRLLERGDIESWIELWAEDADHYYPFGTEMFPRHIHGRDAIHARWHDTPAMFTSMSFPLRTTWVDGDTVLAQFGGECVLKSTGARYTNDYLAIFRFDEAGRIREYWEYFDPIRAGTAFGMALVTYSPTVAST